MALKIKATAKVKRKVHTALEIRKLVKEGRNAAMVVAHPDDETMWGGGLLSMLGEMCTVIACSVPARDPVRAIKFFDACDVYGAKARILPHTEKINGDLEWLHEYTWMLDEFDLIVTHNQSGEYGHAHHRQVHDWVWVHSPQKAMCFATGLMNLGEEYRLPPAHGWRKQEALNCYNHRSPTDGGLTKAEALVRVYAKRFPFEREGYVNA